MLCRPKAPRTSYTSLATLNLTHGTSTLATRGKTGQCTRRPHQYLALSCGPKKRHNKGFAGGRASGRSASRTRHRLPPASIHAATSLAQSTTRHDTTLTSSRSGCLEGAHRGEAPAAACMLASQAAIQGARAPCSPAPTSAAGTVKLATTAGSGPQPCSAVQAVSWLKPGLQRRTRHELCRDASILLPSASHVLMTLEAAAGSRWHARTLYASHAHCIFPPLQVWPLTGSTQLCTSRLLIY